LLSLISSRPPLPEFIDLLKSKNKLVDNVKWQNQILTKKEKEEHLEAVKCYNVAGISRGHLTSICDSFLLLLCELLSVNIEHRYLGKYIIKYTITRSTRKTFCFSSNGGHFYR